MRLTVLNVAYPLARVGPDAVGGAEQVLTQLDFGLKRAGHQSLVVACEGSATSGVLIGTRRLAGELNEHARCQAAQAHRNAIARALEHWRIDVVHMHGVDFYKYLPPHGVPTLATLHLPPAWYPPQVFSLDRPLTYLNCVSASQRRACPPSARLLEEIDNGVADEFFVARHAKRSFALCLGRICPEKGFHLALEAARQIGMPLLLAGEVFPYPEHQKYFDGEIFPRLDPHRRFIGPVGLKRKRRLLAAANCLVVPSLVQETSSLVAMEALACGTPVVAFPSGALADLVEHGKTGLLVHDISELAHAMAQAPLLSSQACRDSARRRFGLQRMVNSYLEIYGALARHWVEPENTLSTTRFTCGHC